MKKFIKYIFGLTLGTIVIMTALDYSYTKIFEQSPPRTKFQLLRSLKDKKVPYLFLGSSRVQNNIIPSVIKEKTQKEAINLGFQASKMSDIYTVLLLIKKYNIRFEKIFIQVDYIFNLDGRSNIMEFELMPFVRENEITKDYFDKHFQGNEALYYVPFYRYCQYDVKLGFREVFSNVISKKSDVVAKKGYVGLIEMPLTKENHLPKTIANSNIYFDKIKSYCTTNKIEVVFFVAPFYKVAKNLDFITKLKGKIPELKDFSGTIQDSTLFQDYNHLNDKGAHLFTSIFTDELLLK
jgi:hypothetical protein